MKKAYLLLVIALAMLVPKFAVAQIQYAGNGHYYQLIAGYRSWNQAKIEAEALIFNGVHGHLAAISSPGVNQFIIANFKSSGLLYVWAGGYQDTSAADYNEPAGGWRWAGGASWGYTNWYPGEPNNYLGGPENYVMVNLYMPGAPWTDVVDTFADMQGYLVEFDGANTMKLTFDPSTPTSLLPTVLPRDSGPMISSSRINYKPRLITIRVKENDAIPTRPLLVRIVASSIPQSGGHIHAALDLGWNPDGVRPHGWLWTLEANPKVRRDAIQIYQRPGGSVDGGGIDIPVDLQTGTARFFYLAPEIAGQEILHGEVHGPMSTITLASSETNILVVLPGLQPFDFTSSGGTIIRYGHGDSLHQDRHFIQSTADTVLRRAADLYQQYQNNHLELQTIIRQLASGPIPYTLSVEPIYLNDVSLPYGGMFDVNGDFAAPHAFHRWGDMADVRTNHLVQHSNAAARDWLTEAILDPNDPTRTTLGNRKTDTLIKRARWHQFALLRKALADAGSVSIIDKEGGQVDHLHVQLLPAP